VQPLAHALLKDTHALEKLDVAFKKDIDLQEALRLISTALKKALA
jgi:hypothetical protein